MKPDEQRSRATRSVAFVYALCTWSCGSSLECDGTACLTPFYLTVDRATAQHEDYSVTFCQGPTCVAATLAPSSVVETEGDLRVRFGSAAKDASGQFLWAELISGTKPVDGETVTFTVKEASGGVVFEWSQAVVYTRSNERGACGSRCARFEAHIQE